jgi:hypothetical protein
MDIYPIAVEAACALDAMPKQESAAKEKQHRQGDP